MEGLTGYTSSSSEDGEKHPKSAPNQSNELQTTSGMESRPNPMSLGPDGDVSKRLRADDDASSAPVVTKKTRSEESNDNHRQIHEDSSPGRDRSPGFFESSGVDPATKQQLQTLLTKVDQLLKNQEKMLKYQEQLLGLLEDGSGTPGKPRQAPILTLASPSHLVSMSPSMPGKPDIVVTDASKNVCFTEFKIPTIPIENITFVNGVLGTPAVAQIQENQNGTKTEDESMAEVGNNPGKVFQESSVVGTFTIPAEFQDEVFGSQGDGNSKQSLVISESDSTRMKELLRWAEKVKQKSCSVGNFATNLVKLLFTKEELLNRNCTGSRGKTALDADKLNFVRYCTFRLYPMDVVEQESVWRKKCVVSIDEFLRRGNRTRSCSRTSLDGKTKDDCRDDNVASQSDSANQANGIVESALSQSD
ncbi:predicted protein [Nematostella vectensis]|uniref:BEN domain-containing protein n=1 Tax=Nematostella vectensis TaxID=45351 RepID=A7T513_NEMVE|nr:predicted protein [Nematostella vectensis]|eukprot:XP_001621051.1 hypothetical protein NEMVEDRAFT_v1g222421 [Nematostella vectensis]